MTGSSLPNSLYGHYRLERVLGQGGMATVYLARDLKHDRQVAFKLFPPESAFNIDVLRFRREIATAARFQHPHICTVYDSGETDGLLWFTMPYIRGETLRERLRREGRLPVDDALRITREAAQALAYAHREGVIHRDVIPALPFCHVHLNGRRPLPRAYPQALVTIGDHLRKRRLDLGLLQREVADRLGVTESTVTSWELNRTTPALRFLPRIITLLGFDPRPIAVTLASQLVARRTAQGLSREAAARLLAIDPATLRRWEKDNRRPQRAFLGPIQAFLASSDCEPT